MSYYQLIQWNVFTFLQVKDAVAMCEFFAWLEDEVISGEITEYSAALKIEEFRRYFINKYYYGLGFFQNDCLIFITQLKIVCDVVETTSHKPIPYWI